MSDHTELLRLQRENNRLVQENNLILRRMQRNARLGFWFRILWLTLLIGIPVFLYMQFVAPTLDSISQITTIDGSAVGIQLQELDSLLDRFRD